MDAENSFEPVVSENFSQKSEWLVVGIGHAKGRDGFREKKEWE